MNTREFTLCMLFTAFVSALPHTAIAACDERSGGVLRALSAQHCAGS